MNCLFCGSDLVERKPMVKDTRKGTRAKLDQSQPRRRYWCPTCKRVQRGT